MQPILVAYGTTEGQTGKIADAMARRLRAHGHRVDLLDTASPAAQTVSPQYQAAMIGGSVHNERHQSALTHFVKANRPWLKAMPVAMFSVSLSAALPDMDSRLEARRALDAWVLDSELTPVSVRCVAGALRYTRYDYLKRQVMRLIAREHGQTGDASHDVEYTDWNDVDAFVDEFLQSAHIRSG